MLRHRLHHRFTDTEDDPYNAKKGLYWSHMGWIFRKPHYPKMALVDRKDLDIDAGEPAISWYLFLTRAEPIGLAL